MTLAPETTPREATGETAPLLEARNLLMDEAFSALDPLIRREMQEQLVELQRKLGRTIVFICHYPDRHLRAGPRRRAVPHRACEWWRRNPGHLATGPLVR